MSAHQRYSEQEFEELVRSALDELPDEFQRALEHVAIVVSDRGAEHHAYGEYVGFTRGGRSVLGGGGIPDEILIFRDTLARDFGTIPSASARTSGRRCVTRSATTSVSTRRESAGSGYDSARRRQQ